MNSALHKESFTAICLRTLKKEGSRVTQGRLEVIQTLARSDRPLSPKQVLGAVQLRSPEKAMDLVSVYRTLEKLNRLHLVHQVGPHGGFLACRHAACGHDWHMILRCQTCGRIEEHEVPDRVMQPLAWFLRDQGGFVADHHAIGIDGVCGNCNGA